MGRKRALENGVEFGRPSSFKGRRKELVNLLNKGFTVKEICKTMGVTKSAVYRELEKLRKEGLVSLLYHFSNCEISVHIVVKGVKKLFFN